MLRIAIYMRLSKEDGCREESGSIRMQRHLLWQYVEENFDNYRLWEFSDDGFTGTNFCRPGVGEMLKLAEKGELDCIVIKDFSRFSRDYLALGEYIERIFPSWGIRLISIGDGYDSAAGQIGGIDIPFRNLMYHLYSKDLSVKVKASLAVRREKGWYISGNCPFGYEKAPDNRHMLVIAEEEAEIVRRIFHMAAEGTRPADIARILNKEGVKTPVEFLIEKGKVQRKPKGGKFLWQRAVVARILKNETYVGSIVCRKYSREQPGGRNRQRPEEEWCIYPQRHAPVIGRELFEAVQKNRGKK
ncbi:hypothetical protein IMSAGC019_04088 [Lachnospiraceae bacterium]|nr:hypothetical protein IMSAGC019_04088 [Lachnospiraceae bacterium]